MFKRELRVTLQFLSDHGNSQGKGRQAHVLHEAQAAIARAEAMAGEAQDAFGREHEGDGEGDEGVGPDIPALIASMQGAGFSSDFILSAVQNYRGRGNRPQQRPRQGPGPARRIATPPRDAKDIKCANCNGTGHMALKCPKPKLADDQRKCHVCGKPGHLA